jgi:hypothetical protein
LAWNNQTVHQRQTRTEQVAPGFEALAQIVVRILQELPGAGLTHDDLEAANEAGQEVLAEVVRPEPEPGKIRRALRSLKGILAPLATGASVGAAAGVQDFAKTAIEQLNPW